MANKAINDLDNAQQLDNTDLLVLWDSSTNTAQNMTGAQFSAWLVSLANGHGGISNFAVVDSGTSGDGQLHTATLTYAGDNSTYTFSWRDGYKGDTGAQTQVFLKYANKNPTEDADMGDTPDSWVGIYVGTAIDDPDNLHYTDLTWYEWKGPKGDGVSYTSQTGTVGLTRTYTMYTADATPVGSFSVTDGSGAVSLVNGIAPDGNGDVSVIVSSVTDLGLTSGSATIAGAYAALAEKQVLICPATDFAVAELPLANGNRQSDGSVEIVKGDGTDGWIEFHGRLSTVGDYRMFFNSSDVPSGTWVMQSGTPIDILSSIALTPYADVTSCSLNNAVLSGNQVEMQFSFVPSTNKAAGTTCSVSFSGFTPAVNETGNVSFWGVTGGTFLMGFFDGSIIRIRTNGALTSGASYNVSGKFLIA